MDYPPGLEARDIEQVGSQDRDDALQEAWAAHLAGEDPRRAVRRYAMREYRHRRREAATSPRTIDTLGPSDMRGAW